MTRLEKQTQFIVEVDKVIFSDKRICLTEKEKKMMRNIHGILHCLPSC